MKRGEDSLYIAIYVDDILVFSKNARLIEKLKKIALHQRGYIRDVLDRFGMADSKPVDTPMDVSP